MAPMIYVLAFMSVVLFVQAIASLVFASRDRTRQVNRRLAMVISEFDTGGDDPALVRTSLGISPAQTPLAAFFHDFELLLRQSDVRIPAHRVAVMLASAAAVIWIVSVFFVGPGIAAAVTSLVASCAMTAIAARLWLGGRRSRRRKAIEHQLPTALDIVTRGLRAGRPVISAIRLAAEEMGDPIGSEFELVVDEATYGLELKDALTSFAKRTGSSDAYFIAVSIAIQAQTGGNLAEFLDNVAKVIRARASLANRVHALASEGRASAMILSALPVLLIAFLGLTHPDYYTSKFSDPIFWPIAGGVCVLYVIGRLMMYRITHFSY